MANFVTWKNIYSVNDPTLDAQHKQVIGCINELYQAMEGPSAAEATKRVMDQLVQYTRTHFEYEEKVLSEIGYPDLAAHKSMHENMRRRTVSLRMNLTLVTARDVLVLLKDWWIDHIQGEDKKYSVYLETLAAVAV